MAKRRKTKKTKKIIIPFEVLATLIFVLLISAIILITLDHFEVINLQSYIDKIVGTSPTPEKDENENDKVITNGELEIVFLELGNKYTGDSIYIKAGDNDILIDAGSRSSSSTTISNKINKYMTDKTLEYVIATHAHQDHISGFNGTKKDPGIFALYDCKTIIDFPLANTESQTYKNYCLNRDNEVKEGAVHYTALECYNNENGAKRSYQLTEDISFEVLYNPYYETKTSSENDYSVCVMFHHGSRKFLFTGDLEEKGEKGLLKYNKLSKVDVFKAGHHGSKTSNSLEFLNVIKPDIVCVTCCAGSDEYTEANENMFPTQNFISNISKFTERVYVTTLADDTNPDGFVSMNGDITISSTKDSLEVSCSNNNIYLKDTEWFKKNRKWA